MTRVPCVYAGNIILYVLVKLNIISSFGLKGSVTGDNSAASITVAKNVINDITQEFEVNTCVGIASGRVYCGLVGSSLRYVLNTYA